MRWELRECAEAVVPGLQGLGTGCGPGTSHISCECVRKAGLRLHPVDLNKIPSDP